ARGTPAHYGFERVVVCQQLSVGIPDFSRGLSLGQGNLDSGFHDLTGMFRARVSLRGELPFFDAELRVVGQDVDLDMSSFRVIIRPRTLGDAWRQQDMVAFARGHPRVFEATAAAGLFAPKLHCLRSHWLSLPMRHPNSA